MMISSTDIQNAYVEMFKNLRNYTWSFENVELIAELEVAVYDAFINIHKLRNAFYQLKQGIRRQLLDDEDLKKSFDEFEKLINENSDHYLRLYQVNEEISDENSQK